LGLAYLGILASLYGFNFWLPQIVQSFGSLTHTEIGWLTTLPNLAAALLMYAWGRRSDSTIGRRWPIAAPALTSSLGLLASAAFASQPLLAYLGLILGAVGLYSALPVFWTLPTGMLSGAAAAVGIAFINSIGNLGGYFGSLLMGYFKARTGDHRWGLCTLAASVLIGGILALSAASNIRRAREGDA
jgi:MFS family permease